MTRTTKKPGSHAWAFRARFRRGAYGWKSSKLAVGRVREAVTEIRRVARRDPVLGAEGAVLFLERVSAALEHVDSSSGAIGTEAILLGAGRVGEAYARYGLWANRRNTYLATFRATASSCASSGRAWGAP